jgi:hypothetical protein
MEVTNERLHDSWRSGNQRLGKSCSLLYGSDEYV